MSTPAPKGTARRDLLIDLQKKAQAKWDEKKAFEVDAPAEGTWDGGKFMVTFPYPYMNGKLHLGHAFSLTKAEFAASYQRMKGKKEKIVCWAKAEKLQKAGGKGKGSSKRAYKGGRASKGKGGKWW